tara:strand:- start:25904 stop:26194 length:291 start_codon:yes stop_codon:yes gene_type:complete
MTEYLKKAVAHKGTVTVNDTTAYSAKRFIGIYFAEDTIVASLKVNNVATDVKATYITTPATAIKAGTYKTVIPTDNFFSEITLTSGSVEIILSNTL